MESLEKLVKPKIDENIRLFENEAGISASSFAAKGMLRSGPYIGSLTKIVEDFIAKCAKDIETICIEHKFDEKALNKYIDDTFKSLVFELFESHVKKSTPPENAMRQQKEVLSRSLENMRKGIERKIKISRPKWYTRIGVIFSAVIGAVVFLAAIATILMYLGVEKEYILKFFQHIL